MNGNTAISGVVCRADCISPLNSQAHARVNLQNGHCMSKKYFKGQEKKGICPSKHIAKIIQPEIIVPAINMET